MTRMNKRKALGQHFLINRGVAEKIVSSIPENNKVILEVGPGKGALTEILLRYGYKIIAVEKDKKLAEWLRKIFQSKDFLLIEGDILSFDFKQLVEDYNVDGIVSNLPYSISTAFVEKLIEHNPPIKFAILMFQKEVAEKLIAPPGSRDTGPLSIALQKNFFLEKLFLVKSGSFDPPPAVDSIVLK